MQSVLRAVSVAYGVCRLLCVFFFFQAEDGIRDLVRSRGLGDVYKRQSGDRPLCVTYWMNRLQELDPAHPLFVTLNPTRELSLIHI